MRLNAARHFVADAGKRKVRVVRHRNPWCLILPGCCHSPVVYAILTTWFSAVIFQQETFAPLVHARTGRTQAPRDGRHVLKEA